MSVKGYQLVAFEWSMITSTLCLVLLRLYQRSRHARLAWFEDGFVILAWCCFLGQVSMDTKLYSMGFFDAELDTLAYDINGEIADVTALKIFYVENATYYWCMYAVKSTMLCFYTRLVPRCMTKTRVCLWITVITVAIGFIVTTMLNLFLCIPISRNWDSEGGCSSGWTSVAGSIVPYVFHLLTDIMIYILPFSVVRVLPLPIAQKIGVGITFALGFLCIFFAVAVIVIGYVSSSATTNWIVAVFEQTWCLSVACAPALKALTNGEEFKKWKKRVSLRRARGGDTKHEIRAGQQMLCERPDPDATFTTTDNAMIPHPDLDAMKSKHQTISSQVDSIVLKDEKSRSSAISEPSRKTSQRSSVMSSGLPPVSTNRQSYDTECQRSGASSPGNTLSIASIIDFHDLERQLQMDDEKRQVKNCSPVLERRSSENVYNASPSVVSSSEKRTMR